MTSFMPEISSIFGGQALNALLEVVSAGVVITDAQGNAAYSNAVIRKILGENMDTRHWCCGAGDGLLPVLQNGVIIKDMEIRVPGEQGEYRLLVSGSPVLDAERKVIGAVYIFLDVTTSKQTEEKLREDEKIIRGFFNAMAEAIFLIDRHDTVLAVNKTVEERLSIPAEQMVGRNIYDFFPEDVSANRKKRTDAVFENGQAVCFVDERQGLYLQNCIYPIEDDNGRTVKLAISSLDITDRMQAEKILRQSKLEAEKAREHAEKLANTDYLTGLLNRRAFMQRLVGELDRSRRSGTDLGLIIADLDFFKRINDTYGHLSGDFVLQEFAAAISRVCRPYDFVGRFGGEEFIVCLPETACDQSEIIALRMCEAVRRHEIRMENHEGPIHITASFGVVSLLSAPDSSVEQLIELADASMYKAKAQGRDRVWTSCKK